MCRLVYIAAGLMALLGPVVAARAADPATVEFFESKVRPLLAENCFECHGPKKQKSGLRLDHISTILKGGERGAEVVPGDVGKSRIVEAVRYENPDLQMPPRKKLGEEKIAILEKWVEMGAPWPHEPAPTQAPKVEEKTFDIEKRKAGHWTWRPIQVGPAPKVSDPAWPVNDIDRYILAKLDEAGLRPAPDADKRTWLRRVHFDLTGLPPTPEQVEAFIADASPRACEKAVDELLQSPRFGERWAGHWMDLVRYAETYGHEFDYPIAEAWRYRDYLIRALNADVPYDRFLTEHLAGDLLSHPRIHPQEGFNESIIATGFWFFHEQTHAPTDVRQHESDRIDNQIDVMSKAFLGLTVGCARCHDHKFDAISTRDFYALAGFLKSSRQRYALLDPRGKIEALTQRLKQLRTQGDAIVSEARLAGVDAANPRQESANRSLGDSAPATRYPTLFEDFSTGYKGWSVGGWAFGDGPAIPGQWGSVLDPARIIPHRAAHSGLLAEKLSGALGSRTFTITEPNIYIHMAGKGGQIRVVIDSYTMDAFNPLLFRGVMVNVNTDGKWTWHTIADDYSRYIGHRAHIEILDHGDGWVAVDQIWFGSRPPVPLGEGRDTDSGTGVSPVVPPKAETIGAGGSPLRADHGRAARATETRLAEIAAQMRKLNNDLPYPLRVLAITDGTPEDCPVYIRGSYRTPGEIVPRRSVEAISGPHQPPITDGSGRLELARRILDPADPFPARVAVNRLWHHLFGRGIVPTVDNFGVLGDKPSHPQLLDYLADRFRREGWSQKAMIRAIVLSRTYRMSSHPGDHLAEQNDPANTLLHRMNVRRLEGEAIRDALLALSGRLDSTMFGPPVPTHLTAFMEGRGRPRDSGPIDGAGRRSIYLEVRRNFLNPMMLAFDTPTPFTAFGRRTVSNVPAQALILMNDPFVVEQAGLWARRVHRESASITTDHRITRMYLSAFSRPPTQDELADAKTFLHQQASLYAPSSADDPNNERPWADLAHVLLNVKEFIFLQ